MKFKKYLAEEKLPNNINDSSLVKLLTHYSVQNKKFTTFYNAYKKHIGDFYDNIQHFKDNWGKTYNRKWVEIATSHIYGEDYGFKKVEVVKLWNDLSKKFKISLEDLEKHNEKWNNQFRLYLRR